MNQKQIISDLTANPSADSVGEALTWLEAKAHTSKSAQAVVLKLLNIPTFDPGTAWFDKWLQDWSWRKRLNLAGSTRCAAKVPKTSY